jgi:lipoate-protein ligase A
MNESPFRLLITPPRDGATNMAIDEAILRARIAGTAPPTLRFYAWHPPTVSLGYGQPLDEAIDVDACARLGIGLVRRPTGGSAILHEGPAAELTYSVVARSGDFAGAEDVLETYRLLGAALARGLGRLGLRADVVERGRGGETTAPTFCFARAGAYEIAAGGRKLVGSAQRRQGGAFLQHGAILLDADVGRLRAVFPRLGDPQAAITTLAEALGRRVAGEEVAAALADAFAETVGPVAVGSLSSTELETADRLAAAKYASDAWTRGGIAMAQHA